jgi:hypothetical protein
MLLNENQIKITDILLKHLKSTKDGVSSIDDYPHKLRENNIEYYTAKPVIQILINNIGLLDYVGNSDRLLMLTPTGNIAAKIGIEKYLNDLNEEKKLQIELAKSNIEANRLNAENAIQNKKYRQLNIIFFIVNSIFAIVNILIAIL